MKWRIYSIGQLYDCGEDMVVYFDTNSGDTHLISAFAAFIIGKIADTNKALEIDDIIELTKHDVEDQTLPELGVAVSRIIKELVALDIVVQA